MRRAALLSAAVAVLLMAQASERSAARALAPVRQRNDGPQPFSAENRGKQRAQWKSETRGRPRR